MISRALPQPRPDDRAAGIARKPALWMVLSALALGASLVHVLIDYSVGQYGHSSSEMSALEATNIAVFGLVYATWAAALAWASGRQKTAGVCVPVLTIALTWKQAPAVTKGLLANRTNASGARDGRYRFAGRSSLGCEVGSLSSSSRGSGRWIATGVCYGADV